MDAMAAALNELRFVIPEPILNVAFLDNVTDRGMQQYQSLDTQIKRKVIMARVIPDINLRGGEEVDIPLTGLPMQQVSNNTYFIAIPKDRTNGRSIMSVQSVGFFSQTVNGVSMYSTGVSPLIKSDFMTNTMNVFNSSATIPLFSTHDVRLKGEDGVVLTGAVRPTAASYLRCTLENPDTLSNIGQRYIPLFNELVALAVQSYIYLNLPLMLGGAYISGGRELAVFQSKVDEWSGAEAAYKELLNTRWIKHTVMSDPSKRKRLLKLTCGGSH